jgi:hypothetical protein
VQDPANAPDDADRSAETDRHDGEDSRYQRAAQQRRQGRNEDVPLEVHIVSVQFKTVPLKFVVSIFMPDHGAANLVVPTATGGLRLS